MEKDNEALAIIIRNAFLEFNAPTCGTVYEDPTTDNLFELFKNNRSVLFVAEEDELLLGCCGVYPTEGLPNDCAELVKFYLSTIARGKGIGKALFNKCLEAAEVLGFKKVYLESLPQFSTAVRIYEKLGFKTLNHPLGNSGHSGCNIWMIKDL